MIFLQNVTKKYAGRSILTNVTYHFPEGERIALVGPNGTGKTTLLNIITGLEEADAGSVTKPKKVTVGYLPQDPNPTPKPTLLEECVEGAYDLREIRLKRDEALARMGENYSDDLFHEYDALESAYFQKGGYALESEARGYLMGLGFKASQFDQSPTSLSGGWRMRLELARTLINKPDFLVLDEPTNHLDLPSMIWLEQFLETFKGTLLFVSHDRDLLNRLSTVTLHLQKGVLTPYKGNFDSFLEQNELKQLQSEANSKNIRTRYEHIERFCDRFRAQPSKAAQVRSRMKMLARLRGLEEAIVHEEEAPQMTLSIKVDVPSGKHVMTLDDGTIGYTSPLATRLFLKIERGQKIAIIGANGIGKSTLLKTISGEIPLLKGDLTLGPTVTIGYYAQDQVQALDDRKTVLENIMAQGDVSEQRARATLGGVLFQKDDVFKKTGVLSGGEKSRLGLSCLLVQKSNFLLLDEPTNHLDMSSTEVLSDALEDFKGTVLFVSHNRSFINHVATHIFAMTSDGRGELFEGKLDDYERLSERAHFPNVLKLG